MQENEPSIYDIDFETFEQTAPAPIDSEQCDTSEAEQTKSISALAIDAEIAEPTPIPPSAQPSPPKQKAIKPKAKPEQTRSLSESEVTMLSFFADEVIARVPSRNFISSQKVAEILSDIGKDLDELQRNEVYAALASHPNIRPAENGGFKIIMPLPVSAKKRDSDTAMSSAEIRKTLKSIKRSPEFRQSKIDAKRIANPRRRKARRSKPISSLSTNTKAPKHSRGKSHNKK